MYNYNVEIDLYSPKGDGHAITNIKAIRAAFGIGLKEAKDMYEASTSGVTIYCTAEQYGRLVCATASSDQCSVSIGINRVYVAPRTYEFDFTRGSR